MARKVLSVELDFKNALKSAEEFSSSLEDSLAKALKQDKGFSSFSKGIHKLEQLSEGFKKKQKKFDEAEGLRQKHLNGELQKHLKSLLEQQKKLGEEIGASAGQSQAYTDELKKQQAELKRQIKLGDHIGGNYESYLKTHNKLAKELQNESEHLGKFSRNLGNAAESAKEIRDYFKDLKDPSKLAEGMEGAAERMGEAFKDGIDVQALSRDLGKGLAKGISTATKAMSGGSGAIMAVGGVIAGTVAALGVLLAAFIAVDKKVKEFNKDIVKTHGALSLMRLGGGDLNKGLQVVKRTVMDLSGNLGVSEQEATQLFDTLDKGGITLDRLTRGARDAADQQKMLTNSLREMHQIANLMGVGLSEYADNLTNYVNDLGMSVNTVNDSFAAIADMASKSSFGTRRFYSMVVQATSGQASLNTRLEDTGDLLMRMSKIMGAKKAAELTGKFAQGLSGMSTRERSEMSIQSRGGMRDIIKREGRAQTQTFGQRANVGAMSTAFARSGQSAIAAPVVTAIRDLQGLTENATAEQREQANQNLQRQIRELSPQNQETLINSLLSSSDRDAQQSGQQLRDVVTLMRGQSDNLAAQTEAMSVFGARGAMAATLARVEGVLGRQFDVSNPRAVEQLIAMEDIGQITSEQRQQITRLASSSQSQYEELERMRSQSGELSAEQQSRLEELGFTIQEGADGQKRILQATYGANHQILTRGLPIRNPQDIFQLQNEAVGGNKQAMKDEATSIAYQTMDATTSVADILENKVAVYIQRVYEWLNGFLGPLLESLPGVSGQREAFEKKRKTVAAFESEIENLQKQSEGGRTRMARLSAIATTATSTPEEKRNAEDELKKLREDQERRASQIQRLRDAAQRVRDDNTYDIRSGFKVSGAQRVAEHVSGPRGARQSENTTTVEGIENLPDKTFATYEEAADYVKQHGGSVTETQKSAAEAIRDIESRASPGASRNPRRGGLSPDEIRRRLGAANGAAPAPAPAPAPRHAEAATAPAAGTPAGGAAPTPVATTPPPARVTEAANAPTVEAVVEAHEDAQAHNQRQRRETRQRHQESQALLKELTGRKLGDQLAISALPMAIAEADAKMRVLEGIYKAGGRVDNTVVEALMAGTATSAQTTLAGEGSNAAKALRYLNLTAGADDFVYRSSGGQSSLTPINREDQLVGMKPGGPIANATGRGTGGNVNISINGGDERRVFEVVRRAIQQAGITPNRVPSGAS